MRPTQWVFFNKKRTVDEINVSIPPRAVHKLWFNRGGEHKLVLLFDGIEPGVITHQLEEKRWRDELKSSRW